MRFFRDMLKFQGDDTSSKPVEEPDLDSVEDFDFLSHNHTLVAKGSRLASFKSFIRYVLANTL
jgi:hypothetical protein